jgi:hypothetical protein
MCESILCDPCTLFKMLKLVISYESGCSFGTESFLGLGYLCLACFRSTRYLRIIKQNNFISCVTSTILFIILDKMSYRAIPSSDVNFESRSSQSFEKGSNENSAGLIMRSQKHGSWRIFPLFLSVVLNFGLVSFIVLARPNSRFVSEFGENP